MCGIFGFVDSSIVPPSKIKQLLISLFHYSESRGKEASGLGLRLQDNFEYIKSNLPARKMIKLSAFKLLTEKISQESRVAFIGHTRLVTNGNADVDLNNQPVHYSGVVLVHNGIICNQTQIWESLGSKPSAELDSEVIAAFVSNQVGRGFSPAVGLQNFFEICEGTASVAMLFEQHNLLVIGSNNCSLYVCYGHNGEFIFASEGSILSRSIEDAGLSSIFDVNTIRRMQAKEVLTVELNQQQIVTIKHPAYTQKSIDDLRRCTRCILPETFPGISFNPDGVCSICQSYEPIKMKGVDALKALCDKHRRSDGKPDCIVSFSGGRDSSYAVHYMKNIMGMNPVTYTYDWGMVTDLARRNIARICGKLGVENILVSADIKKKRSYVKQNLEAWLARPELGMVTLLMAGDKEYFYHVKKIQKQFGIDLVIYGSNQLEQSNFKSAFCGVNDSNKWFFNVSKLQKAKMVFYFAKQYLLNPRYINSSIADTLFAFYCAYIQHHTFVPIFDYVSWDEKEITATLDREYQWESERDSDIQWRIGDGTAALYNHIYHTMAGFTENDTFRSNQIRNGILTRQQGLTMANNDNKTRFEAIRTYAALIGVDYDRLVREIADAKKIY
jgi:glucosamine--fructose-6-phosphate aminotransferase (isomerizing)